MAGPGASGALCHQSAPVRVGPTASRPLLLSPDGAAQALSMSRDSFDRYVRDELRLVRVGRKVLVPVSELENWVERNASRVFEEPLMGG